MSEPNKFRIALGDLRHATIGRHSVFMPVGIGYIASYLLGHVDSEDIEVRLFDDPEKILTAIKEWSPDVIGLSNYCWNVEVSNLVFRQAKNKNPNIICIAGGPEFPIDNSERFEYLTNRKDIDFYLMFEGEVAFARLIKRILDGNDISLLKAQPQAGIATINPETGELVLGDLLPRIKKLDDIPSPYLNGLLDDWFDGTFAPSVEFARGCPFSCGFCYAGQSYFSPVVTFSNDRIKEDLTYIAKKMVDYPNIPLSICDSNFGMAKKDEDIAGIIIAIQDKYNWPNVFNVTTGKANYDRILHISTLLKDKLNVTCSVQSLHPETLDIIKRKNLPLDQYIEVQKEIRKRKMPSIAELIVPLPLETKASFFEGIRILYKAGAKSIVPYTTMLLKGTFLASKSSRDKYGMVTKYRLIPRQFGEYEDEKCFEIEEVCVATNSLSFQEYLECRGFALIFAVFSSVQFDIVYRHLKELGINTYDFLMAVFETIKIDGNQIADIYDQYLNEIEKELWDTGDDLVRYFSKTDNYAKLLSGELGDNLIRKYRTILFIKYSPALLDLAYKVIRNLVRKDKLTNDIKESLSAAQMWAVACRDLNKILEDEKSIQQNESINLKYDILNWYNFNPENKPLNLFNKKVNYKLIYDIHRVTQILEEGKQLYGEELLYRIGKILINVSIDNFWRKCKSMKT